MAKGRTFCREKNQITDSIPFSRHSLPTQELNTALSWDSKVKQFCVFLSWTLFPQMTCKVARDYPWKPNPSSPTITLEDSYILALHLPWSQEPVIIYSPCECVEGENLYSSNDPPYWHSISLVLPFLSFRDDQSLSFSKSCKPPFRSQNSATPFPFSKSCKPPPLPSPPPQVFCFSSYQIFYFPFPVLLAIPPLSIRGVELWGDPRPIFNPPKE